MTWRSLGDSNPCFRRERAIVRIPSGNRPPFRNDATHHSEMISPTVSEMMSPAVPG